MKDFFQLEPSTYGFDWSTAYFTLFIGCLSWGLLSIVYIFAIALLISLFVYKIRQICNHLTNQTYKMQTMLFRALIVQIIISVITIFGPIILLVLLVMLGWEYGSIFIQIFGFFPMSLHSVLDNSAMLYFIRPYREFIRDLAFKMIKKPILNKTMVVSQLNTG